MSLSRQAYRVTDIANALADRRILPRITILQAQQARHLQYAVITYTLL